MKKKLIFLGILMGGVLPFRVKALTGNMAINCDKQVLEVGQSTSCKIVGTSDDEVSALSFLLQSNNVISVSDVVTSSSWQGDGKDKNVALYTDENKKGTFDIATFKVTANKAGNGNVYTEKLLFATKDFQNVNLKDISYNIVAKEKESTTTPTTPSTGDDKPNAGDNTPSTGDDKPNTGDNTPSTGDDKPNTGDNKPSIETPSSENTSNDKNNTKIENPKTGAYTVGGVLLFGIISLIGLVLCKKKNYFSKI